MQFKTNAGCAGCVDAITSAVKQRFPDARLQLDLLSADKVLQVEGVPEDSLHASQVESAIAEAGFKGEWLTRGIENK